MAQPLVDVCPYDIHSPSTFNSKEGHIRHGWLLRFRFPNQLVGYADFHPLTLEKNSESLLENALRGNPGPQFQQSLKWAYLDAMARAAQMSLFAELKAPLSHALVRDVTQLTPQDLENLSLQGFKILKLKLGRDPQAEQAALGELKATIVQLGLKLRLDFNASNSPSTWSQWESWLKTHYLELLDFIEDPLPWNYKIWSSSPLPLALDLEWDQTEDRAKDFLKRIVWKPALGLGFEEKHSSRCVVTHIMDHPLGQLGAVYWALKNGIDTVGGYLNGEQKDSLGFYEEIRSDGPQLKFPRGTGWGFDERLNALQWQSL